MDAILKNFRLLTGNYNSNKAWIQNFFQKTIHFLEFLEMTIKY